MWDGSVISGDLAVDGNYTFQVRVRDAAGNETLAPRRVPTARTVGGRRGHHGAPAHARRDRWAWSTRARSRGWTWGPPPRRYRFAFSRLGARRDIRRDRRRGGALRVRIPSDARTGVYLVRVRARGRRAVWPLAVAGRPPARAVNRPRPLVVLPTVTWQGLNDWDSDLDGFGDTLDSASARSPTSAPFATPRAAAALRHRDLTAAALPGSRERLAYDLTTDLSLARREGPSLGNAPGVAVAGHLDLGAPHGARPPAPGGRGERPEGACRSAASRCGGRWLWWTSRLQDASPPRPDDLFGERTRLFRSDPPAPLVAEEDRLGLFEDVDDLFGEFEVFERSLSLPPDARLLTAAGREEGEPAFVGYRLGKGVVIRPGSPRWAGELEESRLSEEVPRVTERTWSLLSRRSLTARVCHPAAAMTRKLIIAGALVLVALVAGGGIYYWQANKPVEKRGSADEEFDTSDAPEQPKPQRKRIKVPWPTYGFDLQRTKVSPYDHRPPYRRLWSIDAKDTLEFPPTAGYGNVYIAQQKGLFFAVNGKTGKPVFKTKNFKRCAASSPTLGNGMVYQAYMDFVECGQNDPNPTGFVTAMNARTGKQKWRWKGMPVESSPLLKDGILYFGSWDNKVHAIRAKNGKEVWSFQTSERVNTSPAYSKGRIFFANQAGDVYGVNAKTGKQAWKASSGVVGARRPRVLLRVAHGGLRPRVHRQQRRHDVRLRGQDRQDAVGAAARHLHLRRGRRLGQEGLHRHLRRQAVRTRCRHGRHEVVEGDAQRRARAADRDGRPACTRPPAPPAAPRRRAT